ncbi:acyl-CoA dehydrogenase [Aquipuribacter nitratireducens]|uniref:Acyl-CoA dehydrogenase n=1 Tax=Aquipuribacter nitratireducens TaxID=650104 RepID=A0ABW0GN35_9MICO
MSTTTSPPRPTPHEPDAPEERTASSAPDAPAAPALRGPRAEALREALDGDRHALRERLRRELDADWFAPRLHTDDEAHRVHTLDGLRRLAALGHQRLGFDARHGGHDDIDGSVVVYEMLGLGDLSLMVKAGVQWGLFGGAVQALGTTRHHEELLRALMDLEVLGCFAMTEVGHGSDVQGLRTTATYDPSTEEFVVHTPDADAEKTYIGNAARDGHLAVVFAQLETAGERHGVHALLVPLRDRDGSVVPGVRITDNGHKAGLNGVDNGRIAFDHVRVPRTALLDRFADVAGDGTYSSDIESSAARFFTTIGALVKGRITIGGAAATATKVALVIALRRAEERAQFRRPDGEEVVLLDYLAHQRRLLPALARTYALSFAQSELVAGLAGTTAATRLPEHEQRRLEVHAAGLKAATTWHATTTIQACREACGGAGYMAESRLPGLRADTDVFTTFEGDNTVLLQLVAKGLLAAYKDRVEDLDTLGLARTVVSGLFDRARHVLPQPGREPDVTDRAQQLALLVDRERHVVEGLARRVRHARSGDGDAFEATNAAQPHMLAAARAHLDRVQLEAFVTGIERCEDAAAAAVLEQVCDLFALSLLEQEKAWFLEHGRMSGATARQLTRLVDEACGALRPHARELVDAFGVPGRLLQVAGEDA